MNKQEIKKIIKNYMRKKYILIAALIASFLFFIVGMFFIKNKNISIVAYMLMLLIVVLAYLFPINCKLSKMLTVDDFKGILDYLIDISDDMSNRLYFDSLVMIKNSLDEIAHYHIEHENQCIKDCIFYLQGQFDYGKGSQFVPLKLYNRKYLKKLCTELKLQITNGIFDANVLQNINDKSDNVGRKRKLHKLSVIGICNFILIFIVICKIMVTLDINYYNRVNSDVFLRFFYNLGADIIAVVLAIAPLVHRNK